MKQKIIIEQLNELINKGLEEIDNNPFIPESMPIFGKSLTKKTMRKKLLNKIKELKGDVRKT